MKEVKNSKLVEPKMFKEAKEHERWVIVMIKEIEELQENNTWTFLDLPKIATIIESRWVYQIKQKFDSSIDHLKVHLIAQDYNQSEGVDFIYAYSPEIKPAIVRCVIGIFVARGWPLHQIDVRNTFLNNGISETVYMRQLLSFDDKHHPNKV